MLNDTANSSETANNSSSQGGGGAVPTEECTDDHCRQDDKTMPRRCQEKWQIFTDKWARCVILRVERPVVGLLVKLTKHAATYPKIYIAGIIILSIVMLVIGLVTNFNSELDQDSAWTPKGTRTARHGDWVDSESGFPSDPRYFLLMVHRDGDNILQEGSAREGVQRLFQAFDLVRNVEGYDELCYKQEHAVWDHARGNYSCPLHSITTFWNQSSAIFEDEIDSDEQTIGALSALYYPSGKKVDRKTIMGHATQVDDNNPLLVSATSYVTIFQLTPIDEESEPVEKRMIDTLLDLKEQWAAEGTPFQVELDAERTFSDEFNRAITKDLPLIPIVFVIMTVMCILIFSRRDRVLSRGAVGLGATVTVLLSMMASYGLLFICGVPFSFLTQILPFIMFGIGLDNAFIIHGAYERTDPTEDAPERVAKTIQDIGGTITITTFTTALAFGLGCSSSIPAIFWLCCYAFPTVLIDYLYQLTFFIAVLSLDEQRVKAKRKDWCCCRSPRVDSEESASETPTTSELQPHIADKIMACYASILMKTWVKILVVVGFAGLLGGCIYSTSLLEQSFEFVDLVPEDSYIIPFWNAYQDYYERTFVRPAVYFRYVDQSDYTIQEQMEGYVNALVELDEISDQPAYFWLRDFAIFNESDAVRDLSFNEQLEAFLSDRVYGPLYVEDMVVDENGTLTASRTFLEMDGVDLDIVKQQETALENQKRVTEKQPINQANDPWPFFNFEAVYRIWEFYAVTVEEIIFTSILGVIAVSCVALIAIPHWSAIIYIAPVVTILYVDLLGVIQFSGLSVNSVTYLGMVLSIGLIVDYTYHILLRYVESRGSNREERVNESLRTIGASVFVGGLSTLLGVVPLAFSSSHIIRIVFIIFIALVTLGLSHGLMLLPVVLSVVGPLNTLPDLNGEQESEGQQQAGDKAATTTDSVLAEARDVDQAVEPPPESAPDVDEGQHQMDDVPLESLDYEA